MLHPTVECDNRGILRRTDDPSFKYQTMRVSTVFYIWDSRKDKGEKKVKRQKTGNICFIVIFEKKSKWENLLNEYVIFKQNWLDEL